MQKNKPSTNRINEKNLILFDLDGTLLDVFGEHSASLERTVEDIWGIPTLLPKHKRYGIPQRETLRRVCQASNVDPEDIEAKLTAAMNRMTEVMSDLLPDDLTGRCLLGARDLLDYLQSIDDVYLVIATGTLGPTTEILLKRSRLDKYFPTGAYGHECDTREKLVELARRRGWEHYGLNSEVTRVVTIGDAPSDILAGKSIDAYTISVATSLFNMEALEQYQPDVVLADLENTELVTRSMLQRED
jgi:phosphoglycolate phosphatase-like HAD superfamily hydrolase